MLSFLGVIYKVQMATYQQAVLGAQLVADRLVPAHLPNCWTTHIHHHRCQQPVCTQHHLPGNSIKDKNVNCTGGRELFPRQIKHK